ncbi:MAG: hypothetical protein EAZ58_05090 [Flavobacterium sp.]|nr:MAG: hypothetical protein EAZ58_05090 [Flavobacterium sp.]
MHHLKEYAEQKKWKNKIESLLNLWNEGLDLFFEEEKVPRELVIMEVFDSIQNSEYGALKFPDFTPKKLNESSDIELVIEKKEAKKLLNLLRNHHLVRRVLVQKKSFKYAIQAVLVDGSILALNLIWQIKIRELEIMNAHEVYKNNPLSPFGIKQARTEDVARFTVLSSLLTNTNVASQYTHHLPLLEKSQNVLDLQINYCIQNNNRDSSKLLQFIKKNPKNQSLLYIKNSFMYVLDTLQNCVHNIRYSTVFNFANEAKKLTTIKHRTFRKQNQPSKPIIFLSEHPSVLPMPRKWRQLKEVTQFATVNTSSNQVKNKITAGALLQFSYYYLNHIIGQFVIYFKYKIRGYVVMYDRNYFDFIRNQKQNINSTNNLILFGNLFFIKPDLTFSLAEDIKTITYKKQNLNSNAVKELTSDYRLLFDKQHKTSSVNSFQSSNTVDFEVTKNQLLKMLTIMN